MNISILKSLYLLNKVKDIQRLNVLKFYYKHCHNQLSLFFKGLYLKLDLTCTFMIPGKKIEYPSI